MDIRFEIRGIVLNEEEIAEIHRYYEVACTAEILLGSIGTKYKTEEQAMEMGQKLLDKFDEQFDTNVAIVNAYLGVSNFIRKKRMKRRRDTDGSTT